MPEHYSLAQRESQKLKRWKWKFARDGGLKRGRDSEREGRFESDRCWKSGPWELVGKSCFDTKWEQRANQHAERASKEKCWKAERVNLDYFHSKREDP